MKKTVVSIVILSILLLLSETSFAQKTTSGQLLSRADYIKKSKKQKTAAWIFTGAGTALLLVTAGSASADALPSPGPNSDESETHGTVPAILGLASIATGVYFFIESGKNKRRARSASVFIDMEKIPMLQQTSVTNYSYPALGVRINL